MLIKNRKMVIKKCEDWKSYPSSAEDNAGIAMKMYYPLDKISTVHSHLPSKVILLICPSSADENIEDNHEKVLPDGQGMYGSLPPSPLKAIILTCL